ncbi:MAG TPA: pitrilysin family protein, partial [Chroococcales cyanobacterium]
MKIFPLLCTACTVSLLQQGALAAPELTTTKTIMGAVESFTLPNGLKVLLKENHAAPVVTWAVTYKVGSRNEAVGCTGATHMLEHMMFKGTKSLGKGQIAQLLGRNGASFNASTGPDMTNYYETYSSDKLEMGIRLEADRMRNSLILDSERKSEMTVVRNEMEQQENNPSQALSLEFCSQAYKAHPYHHPTIGWRSDVEGMPTKRLKQFYDTFYHPNNAVAVLVGDFKTPEAMSLIEKYFGRIPAAQNIPQVYTREEAQEGRIRFAIHRRGETNLVRTGWHIPSCQSPDLAPLLVLENLLGLGKNSRLNKALVEKQLATGAWSYCGVQRDPSLFQLGSTLRPGISPEKGEQAMLSEIERLKQESVTDLELQEAKNQAEADYIFQNDGTSGLAMMLGRYEAIAGNWRRAIDLLEEIKQVQPADLTRVVKSYFNDDNLTVGWYVSTPDGPMRALPKNSGNGKAVASNTRVKPLPLLDFEKRAVASPKLTLPIRKVLSNGLTVLVIENKNNPTVSMSGFIRAGGSLNPAGKEGLASLTAEMLDKGTTKRDKLTLARDLDFVSAQVDFSGRIESTGINASCLSKDLERTLGVMAEELTSPAFPKNELAKAKADWITSIRQSEERPEVRARRAFNHQIFKAGHPYRDLDPSEKIAAIEGISQEDLKAFHSAHYGANAVSLAVVGDVKAEEVCAELERLFRNWGKVAVSP